jgi:hypothetical protein
LQFFFEFSDLFLCKLRSFFGFFALLFIRLFRLLRGVKLFCQRFDHAALYLKLFGKFGVLLRVVFIGGIRHGELYSEIYLLGFEIFYLFGKERYLIGEKVDLFAYRLESLFFFVELRRAFRTDVFAGNESVFFFESAFFRFRKLLGDRFGSRVQFRYLFAQMGGFSRGESRFVRGFGAFVLRI